MSGPGARAGGVVLAAALLTASTTTPVQDLRARLRAAPPDVDVTFHFAARVGVCGDGDVIVRQRPVDGTTISFSGNVSTRDGRDFDRLDTWCRPGPVHVRLRRTGGTVHDLDLAVGRAFDGDARDMGAVDAADAVTLLVEDLGRSEREVGRRALHAASLAAAEAWPALLGLAHDDAIEPETRRSAIRWLAVDASDRLLAGQPALDAEGEMRRQAVFALSRRKDETSRAALRDLAGPGSEPTVRAAAVYWLGMSRERDEALPIIEAVLRGS